MKLSLRNTINENQQYIEGTEKKGNERRKYLEGKEEQRDRRTH